MLKVNSLCGVYAALPTPFGDDGRPQAGALDPLIDSLLDFGVSGFCVAGATGEYALYDVEERLRLFRHVAKRVAQRVPLVLGIGAERSRPVVGMAKAAKDLGASAVLLPPPSYFRSDVLDLPGMIQEVAENAALPVLLYHIPQFTNPLRVSDAIELVQTVETIVGIKDSSGRRETLEQFAAAKQSADFVLLAGSDELFLTALELNADGAISGVCSVFPQLLIGIYQAFRSGVSQQAAALQLKLQEFVAAIVDLPPPWGIKIALEVEGFPMGPLSWPAGPRLARRITRFRQWLEAWRPSVHSLLHGPGSSGLQSVRR